MSPELKKKYDEQDKEFELQVEKLRRQAPFVVIDLSKTHNEFYQEWLAINDATCDMLLAGRMPTWLLKEMQEVNEK